MGGGSLQSVTSVKREVCVAGKGVYNLQRHVRGGEGQPSLQNCRQDLNKTISERKSSVDARGMRHTPAAFFIPPHRLSERRSAECALMECYNLIMNDGCAAYL